MRHGNKEDGKKNGEDDDEEENDAQYNEPLSRHPAAFADRLVVPGGFIPRGEGFDIAQTRPTKEHGP